MILVKTNFLHIDKMIKVAKDKILLVNMDQNELLDATKLSIDEAGYKKLDFTHYEIRGVSR